MSNTRFPLPHQRFDRIRMETEVAVGKAINEKNIAALLDEKGKVITVYLKNVMTIKEEEEWKLKSSEFDV